MDWRCRSQDWARPALPHSPWRAERAPGQPRSRRCYRAARSDWRRRGHWRAGQLQRHQEAAPPIAGPPVEGIPGPRAARAKTQRPAHHGRVRLSRAAIGDAWRDGWAARGAGTTSVADETRGSARPQEPHSLGTRRCERLVNSRASAARGWLTRAHSTFTLLPRL